jgi:hypothetical protein
MVRLVCVALTLAAASAFVVPSVPRVRSRGMVRASVNDLVGADKETGE